MLSAVEGLNTVSPLLHKVVVPVTICILVALFFYSEIWDGSGGRRVWEDHVGLVSSTRGHRIRASRDP